MAWRNKLPAVSISHNNFNMVPKRAIRQWFVMRVRVLYWLLFKGSKAILSRITGKTKIIERKDTLETFNLRTNLQKSIWVRSYTVLFYTSFTAIKVLKIISYLLEDNIPLEFLLSLFLFGRDFSASEYNAPDKFCLPSPETKALFRTSRNELNQFKYMLMRSFGGLKVSGSESKVLKGDFHKKNFVIISPIYWRFIFKYRKWFHIQEELIKINLGLSVLFRSRLVLK